MRRFAVVAAVCCGALVTQSMRGIGFGEKYGFGAMGRKHVQLVRRVAPDFPLSDTSIAVKVAGQGEAQRLQTLVETMLVQSGPRLSLNQKQPVVEVRCTLTSYSAPREDFKTENKVTTVQFSGSVSATFQAVIVRSGDVLVAGQEQAVLGGTYNATDDHRSYYDLSSENSGGHSYLNLPQLTGGGRGTPMPTAEELAHRLMTMEARNIASHLVLVSEQVDVLLAKGPVMEDANKRAQAGQWTDALTMLEGTKALDRPEEESYRQYNIGVANEALAYKAEDLKSAQKFLEEASTAYSKALEENAKEKYFLEPQNRIQTAMVRYRKLADQSDARQKRLEAALRQAEQQQAKGEAVAGEQAGQGGAAAGTRGVATPAPASGGGEMLTNDSVLKMVKAKFSERMILNKIQASSRVQFDTSVDGMVRLKQAGVTDTEIQMMDQRMQSKQGGAGSR